MKDKKNDLLLNSKKPLIAVVDDEPDILELISINLKKSHFQAETFLLMVWKYAKC
jgi:FixJ family two-component response regulator